MNAAATANSAGFELNHRNHNHLPWLLVGAKRHALSVLRRSKLGSIKMRRMVRLLAAASAIVSAAALAPASAMTVGTAAGVQAAVADTSALQDIARVCRHRFFTSRRVCWWQPDRLWRHRHWRSRRWW